MSMYRNPWKNIKDALARQEENLLRRTASRNRRLAKLGLFRSKVSNPGSRATPDEDQMVMRKIAKYIGYGAQVALVDRPLSLVHKSKVSILKKKRLSQSYSKRLSRSANDRIQLVGPWIENGAKYKAWFPNWDHASSLVKAMAYGMAIPETRRHTFTLKLTDEVIEQALRSKKGFAGFMQDRIARHLRRAIPVGNPKIQFVFVVEAWGKWEKPHVQGAINLGDQLPFGEYGFEIDEALRKAGGRMEGKSRGTQLNVQLLYDPAGWFGYLGKRRMVTAQTLANLRKRAGIPALTQKESLLGATNELQRAGKRWFCDARTSGRYVLRDIRRPA